jgi:UDP-2,3-diacylglucosamine hydrolase
LRICICKQKNRRSPPVFCVLRGEAKSADALYILGDLFEAWIGDDDPNPLHQKWPPPSKRWSIPASPATSFTATAIFVGQRYARESGMTLLPEEQVLDLYGATC